MSDIFDAMVFATPSKHDLTMYESATHLRESEWDGPVYVPGRFEDGFFKDVADLRARCSDDGLALPPWVFCCTAQIASIDVDRALEDADERLERSDPDPYWIDEEELRTFIAAWNAKQTYSAWHEDGSRVVILESASLEVGSE